VLAVISAVRNRVMESEALNQEACQNKKMRWLKTASIVTAFSVALDHLFFRLIVAIIDSLFALAVKMFRKLGKYSNLTTMTQRAKSISILLFTVISISQTALGQTPPMPSDQSKKEIDKTIFVYGGGANKAFIKYVAGLTNKANPRICFVPTASADNPNGIVAWYANCEDLSVRPYVMKTFLNSSPTQMTFEETIMSMDAIIVGGGSTLNMIAIWKAQGIDTVLRKAYDKGIILAGGSAGSLCWFTGGYSDSRPKKLSIVYGLGFLNFTHCPHYHSEPGRKPLYNQAILDGKLKEGYACDDMAGLLFVNGKLKKSLSLNADNNNYFIRLENGKIKEELLPAEIIK
jgi:dipeptidase E